MRGTYFKYALLIEEDVYNAATPNFLLKYLLEKEKKTQSNKNQDCQSTVRISEDFPLIKYYETSLYIAFRG